MASMLPALECPVCLERFQEPKSLSCGHTFCGECLQKVWYKNQIVCPTCRRETNVTGVDELIKPFALLEVIEALDKSKVEQEPQKKPATTAARSGHRYMQVADSGNFEFLSYQRCMYSEFDRTTGLLSYKDPQGRVAQFIGSQEITKDTSFSVVIKCQGKKGAISIGLVHEDYRENCQPGWFEGSIGYHADDGGLFHNWSFAPANQLPQNACQVGDKLGCHVRFSGGFATVVFSKNDLEVYRRKCRLILPWFPAVGMHSAGEKVQLLESLAWILAPNTQEPSGKMPWEDISTKRMKYCSLNYKTGILRYDDTEGRISHFIGSKRIGLETSFAFEIISTGEQGRITVGLVPWPYPENKQPGLELTSIGYHTDDGILYCGSGAKFNRYKDEWSCEAGDRVDCLVYEYEGRWIVKFSKNRKLDYRLRIHDSAVAFYPAIGMNSPGEKVKLLDDNVWM